MRASHYFAATYGRIAHLGLMDMAKLVVVFGCLMLHHQYISQAFRVARQSKLQALHPATSVIVLV